jgi:hypothetical protein
MQDFEARIRAMFAAEYAQAIVLRCIEQNNNMETLPDALAAYIELMERAARVAKHAGNTRVESDTLEGCKLLREAALYLPLTSPRLLKVLAGTPPTSAEADSPQAAMAT